MNQENETLSSAAYSGNNLPKAILIATLFLPWIGASLLQAAPITSYWIAWLGSFFIFYQTWFSSSRFILPDLPVHKQIMRPLFLQQLIFAGFMCCTSIFYLFDTLGYRYFEEIHNINTLALRQPLELIARCQRLSVLGHAVYVTGILLVQSRGFFKTPTYISDTLTSKHIWIVRVTISLFLLSLVLERIPPLAQFSIGFYNVAVLGGAVVFVEGIIKKDISYLAWGGSIFILNVINSTISGFKEPIIINFILFACLLFPYYKKLVLIFSVPLFVIILLVSSTYTTAFRQQAWSGELSAEEARSEAFENVFAEESADETPKDEAIWDFLVHRFSEIGMFTEFVRQIPELTPYYSTQLVENSLLAIIPRALWNDKPITETLAMERVYEAGVVDRRSAVSAKTRPIVDAYVSAGMFGVVLYMFVLGALSQWFNNKCEDLFGGYAIGSVIMYNGFYQQLWRGETIEFMVNTVFWSFIAMYLLFKGLRLINFIQKN